MWFPLTSLCLIACLLGAVHREGRHAPLVLALSTWVVSLLLATPVIFAYDVAYSLKADIFVAACLASVTILYLICRHTPRSAPESSDTRSEVHIANVLGVIGALGCVLLLVDASINAGLHFSPAYLLDNLSAIRTDNADALAASINRAGLLVFLGTYLAPCAVVSVLAAVHFGRRGGRSLRMLGVLNLVLIALVSLAVYAGRATVVNVILLALVSLFVSGRRISPFRPRTMIVAALLLAAGWYFSTSWLGTREQNVDANGILRQPSAPSHVLASGRCR